MALASSAYDSPESRQAIPARMNETTTAGPASGTTTPSTTKMPVPITDPTASNSTAMVPSDRSRWTSGGDDPTLVRVRVFHVARHEPFESDESDESATVMRRP